MRQVKVCGGRQLSLLLALGILQACANAPTLRDVPTTSQRIELRNTPFFPQQEYYCGPASLGTLLSASGVVVTDLQPLVDQVYLPAKRGTLQAELLAATRRAQRIPFVIAPDLSALVAELSAGRPVLVLQDLAPIGKPAWHYAVVVGYDIEDDTIILRSGKTFRKTLSTFRFMRSWERAGNWGFVALRPGELPVTQDTDQYLRAVEAFLTVASNRSATAAYKAATDRWPENERAWIGLSEALYRSQELSTATKKLRQALTHHPDSVALHNNLALILSKQGCGTQARKEIADAIKLAKAQGRFLTQVADTQRTVLAGSNDSDPNCR